MSNHSLNNFQCVTGCTNIEFCTVSAHCRKWLPEARLLCLTTILMFQRVMVVWKGSVVHAALKLVERSVYFKLTKMRHATQELYYHIAGIFRKVYNLTRFAKVYPVYL